MSKEHAHEEGAEVDQRVRNELSCMISDLNEVRMRLDAVIRRLASECGETPIDAQTRENAEDLRVQLAGQLDRIRQKLLARMPDPI